MTPASEITFCHPAGIGTGDGNRRISPLRSPSNMKLGNAGEVSETGASGIECETRTTLWQLMMQAIAATRLAGRITCLHVPSIGLIVGGDVVYNGIHPYLGETDTQSRIEWISTLDKLEALKPKAVIAGHKVPENDDNPRIIAETRQYLRDFNRLNTATTTARELYNAMLEIYPDRVNPGSLWGAANTAKKQA
jgi:hypothetical protein